MSERVYVKAKDGTQRTGEMIPVNKQYRGMRIKARFEPPLIIGMDVATFDLESGKRIDCYVYENDKWRALLSDDWILDTAPPKVDTPSLIADQTLVLHKMSDDDLKSLTRVTIAELKDGKTYYAAGSPNSLSRCDAIGLLCLIRAEQNRRAEHMPFDFEVHDALCAMHRAAELVHDRMYIIQPYLDIYRKYGYTIGAVLKHRGQEGESHVSEGLPFSLNDRLRIMDLRDSLLNSENAAERAIAEKLEAILSGKAVR